MHTASFVYVLLTSTPEFQFQLPGSVILFKRDSVTELSDHPPTHKKSDETGPCICGKGSITVPKTFEKHRPAPPVANLRTVAADRRPNDRRRTLSQLHTCCANDTPSASLASATPDPSTLRYVSTLTDRSFPADLPCSATQDYMLATSSSAPRPSPSDWNVCRVEYSVNIGGLVL